MNFLNLKYFCVVAEELSFTRAAQKLFISQQSLSLHISKLEDEFGMVLFNRTQPLTLTEAGRCLYQHSKQLLSEKRIAEKAMQDIKDFRNSDLTIAIPISRGSIMLADILPEFHRLYPQVKLNLIEGSTRQIQDALYQGEADLYIGFAINDPAAVQEETLHREGMYCAVPTFFLNSYLDADPGAPRPGTLQTIDRFAGCPFIKMGSDTWLGNVFDRCCAEQNFTPDILLETASMTTLVSLCSVGMGAIVIPGIFLHRRAVSWNHADWRDSVAVYPLDFSAGQQTITIAYLKKRFLSRAAKEFIRLCQEHFSDKPNF